jgi:hypothetical protein
MNKYLKWLLIFTALYFLGHAIAAMADETVIINQPDGGQRVCVIQGSYVICY